MNFRLPCEYPSKAFWPGLEIAFLGIVSSRDESLLTVLVLSLALRHSMFGLFSQDDQSFPPMMHFLMHPKCYSLLA